MQKKNQISAKQQLFKCWQHHDHSPYNLNSTTSLNNYQIVNLRKMATIYMYVYGKLIYLKNCQKVRATLS